MRKLATIRVVNGVQAIDGADLIELVLVDGWKCVSKKGEFKVGDPVIYCEIDSFLPIRDEFEFLRKSSLRTMNGVEGFRLRTIKFRGQISQGLLLNPSILGRSFDVGEDVTDELNIEKYEQPVPACLNGDVVGPFPSFISKTDEERIQNLTDHFDRLVGKTFYVSEKLDGTSFTVFINDGSFGVCGRNWQLAENDSNTHWQVVRELDLRNKLRDYGFSVAIQAELVGPGIQGNPYKLKSPTIFVFNVFDIKSSSYIEKAKMESICGGLGLTTAPYIGDMVFPDNIDELILLSEGKSKLNNSAEREGLVWVSGFGDDRISFKVISNKFLVKNG